LLSIKSNKFFYLVIYLVIFLAASLYCNPLLYAKPPVKNVTFTNILDNAERLLKSDIKLAFAELTTLDGKVEQLSIEQQLTYYLLLSEAYVMKAQFITAKQTSGKGLRLAKKLSSPNALMSELLYLRGFAFENLGDLEKAVDNYKKGLEVAESVHDNALIAAGLIELGAIAYLRNDHKRALTLLNDAYKISEQTDDDELKGKANSELGIAYSKIGQYEQAMAYYLQSYKYYKNAGQLLAALNSLGNLAGAHVVNKQYDEAIVAYEKIILESNGHGPSHIMYGVYTGLAWIYLNKEDRDPELAYKFFLQAEQQLKGSQRYDNKLQFYLDHAFVLFQLKRYEETLTSIALAQNLLDEHESLKEFRENVDLSITNLKSKSLYELKRYKEAYQAKSLLPDLLEKSYENEDVHSLAETRLSLESEQADLKQKLLQNENIINEASLVEAKKANEEQRLYLIISALVALALAWLLVKLIYSQRQLEVASTIDSLTGIANRRSLMKKTSLAVKLAKTKNLNISILVIDIDHFKDVNDSLGHSQGDVVLKEVVYLTSSLMRKSDIFGRLGGEEFMVCLPEQNLQSATDIAERIRLRIADKKWPLRNIQKITVSIGVASFDNDADLNSFIQRADKLLYKAKASGRNKVCN
jgi:diguanylate cyclase (GGDEF)-like protein